MQGWIDTHDDGSISLRGNLAPRVKGNVVVFGWVLPFDAVVESAGHIGHDSDDRLIASDELLFRTSVAGGSRLHHECPQRIVAGTTLNMIVRAKRAFRFTAEIECTPCRPLPDMRPLASSDGPVLGVDPPEQPFPTDLPEPRPLGDETPEQPPEP